MPQQITTHTGSTMPCRTARSDARGGGPGRRRRPSERANTASAQRGFVRRCGGCRPPGRAALCPPRRWMGGACSVDQPCPDRRITDAPVVHPPGAPRPALRRRVCEPGRISEPASRPGDAHGGRPRAIRAELSVSDPGHSVARSRPARPPGALGEWDPAGGIDDRRPQLWPAHDVCRHLSPGGGGPLYGPPRPLPRLALSMVSCPRRQRSAWAICPRRPAGHAHQPAPCTRQQFQNHTSGGRPARDRRDLAVVSCRRAVVNPMENDGRMP